MTEVGALPTAIVGANVRAEMARRGLSQAALSARLGINQSGVSARLRGAIPWDINEVVAVSRLLGIGIDDLLLPVPTLAEVSA